jgi:YVTN family beta-propeller protein
MMSTKYRCHRLRHFGHYGRGGLEREDATKLRICRLLAIAAFVSCFLASAQTLAQNTYITNFDNTVSVISTATNTVTATIPVGSTPFGVAVLVTRISLSARRAQKSTALADAVTASRAAAVFSM